LEAVAGRDPATLKNFQKTLRTKVYILTLILRFLAC
jgi:hypothetical protein